MSPIDVIIVLVAVAIVFFGISYQVKKRKKLKAENSLGGCPSCGGGCCPASKQPDNK